MILTLSNAGLGLTSRGSTHAAQAGRFLPRTECAGGTDLLGLAATETEPAADHPRHDACRQTWMLWIPGSADAHPRRTRPEWDRLRERSDGRSPDAARACQPVHRSV